MHNLMNTLLIVDFQASKEKLFLEGRIYRGVPILLVNNDTHGLCISVSLIHFIAPIEHALYNRYLLYWWDHIHTQTHTIAIPMDFTHSEAIALVWQYIFYLIYLHEFTLG